MGLNKNYEKLFIGGKWVSSNSNQWIQVENPANKQIICRVPAGDNVDVDLAVSKAKEALDGWKATLPGERKAILQRALDLMNERIEEIATIEVAELGSPKGWAFNAHAKGPLKRFEHFLKIIDDFQFEEDLGRSRVVKEPVGIIACLTPWNYPLDQVMQKVVPAMLTGNTVVLKPSQITPLSAYVLCESLEEAGLPPGVLNMVTGKGGQVGNLLCSHQDVDMVSFTGSTQGGKEVGKLALDSVKKITLELGGKSALVVLKGADYPAAVGRAMASSFNNTGQTCSALTRLIVPKEDLEEIHGLVRDFYKDYNVGDPTDSQFNIGPVSGPKQFKKVREYIEIGLREGAEIIAGQVTESEGEGYFIQPVVFSNVTGDMTIAKEEIFGPVLSILSYDSVSQAIELANNTIYGLDGAVFGPYEEAVEVANQMKTGRVTINNGRWDPAAPFGGYKQSGLGREGGKYGLEEFVEIKSILDRTK